MSENIITGYITLNNYNKNIDYIIGFIFIFSGILFGYINNFTNYLYKKNIYLLKISKFRFNFFIIFSIILINLYYLYSYLEIPNFIFIFILILINLTLYKFSRKNNPREILAIIISIAIVTLFFKILSSTAVVGLIIFIIGLTAISSYRMPGIFFVSLVAILCTKQIYGGPFIISDAFHTSEYYTSIIDGNFFEIFPNIGLYEELLPLVLAKGISFLTLDNLTISLATSRSIISLSLLILSYRILYKINRCVAFGFSLILPMDRITLLLSLLFSIIIIYESRSKLNSRFWSKLILLSIPIIFLGISPPYLSLFFVALYCFISNNIDKIKRMEIFLLFFVWLSELILLKNYLLIYLEAYFNFNLVNTQAYGLPIGDINFENVLKLFFLSLIGMQIGLSIKKAKHKWLLIITTFFIVIIYIGYGFTRMDPGPSRIIGLGSSIILLYYLLNYSKYIYILPAFIVVVIFFTSLNNFGYINKDNLNFSYNDHFLNYSDENLLKITELKKYTNENKFILYSDPGLKYYTNSILPPFTTPYVTVGKYAQNRNLDFFIKNQDLPIYLGKSFITFDEVDIRSRAPEIFKFLSQNYVIRKYGDYIFAVPVGENEIPSNEFFSGFDIKKSLQYYKDKAENKSLYYELDCIKYSPGKYKMVFQSNFYYADLECGRNNILKIFGIGEFMKIEREL